MFQDGLRTHIGIVYSPRRCRLTDNKKDAIYLNIGYGHWRRPEAVSRRYRRTDLGIFLNVVMAITFTVAAIVVVATVNRTMRQQALVEAQAKARIILDRNLATHTYFSHIMKPSIFAWSEPFRTKDYFDHTWMSSTFAVREIEKYFKSLSPSGYSFKDAAINARSPENEADAYERAFIEKLNNDRAVESESAVRTINGKPYLVVLRKGETMESSCLRCHSAPNEAPKGLTDYYGAERSFNRRTGEVVSAVSLRIPLSEAFAAANVFSLKLSTILLVILASLFATQYLFYRRYLLRPLGAIREKAAQIATDEQHLGEQMAEPFGRELGDLTDAFNAMSVQLRHDRDHLEELVVRRTQDLKESEAQLQAIFSTVGTGIIIVDRKTKHIIEANPTALETTGLSRDSIVGQVCHSLVCPAETGRCPVIDLKQRIDHSERKLVCAGGQLKDVLKTVHPVTIGGKECFVESFVDITDRKLAEERLAAEHRRVETLLQHAPFGIMLIAADGSVNYVNPKFTELLGYNTDDIPDGRAWFRRAYPDTEYRHQVIAAWVDDMKAAANGEPRVRTFTVTCKDGMEKVIHFIPVQLPSGEQLISLEDRTDLVRYQQELAYLAAHDPLTGLLNRRSLEQMLGRAIARAKRGTTSSLLYMDLDRFKEVNDRAGHSAGDQILITLAALLKEALRTEDMMFRVGGDEFGVLLEGINGTEAPAVAERLCSLVASHPFRTEKGTFSLSLSIGLVEINGRLNIDELLSRADTAMYQAKGQGGNGIVVAPHDGG
jgi:diguanylate cyclase (GGDEF)-like protein/PAS domain S-box-containing protein